MDAISVLDAMDAISALCKQTKIAIFQYKIQHGKITVTENIACKNIR